MIYLFVAAILLFVAGQVVAARYYQGICNRYEKQADYAATRAVKLEIEQERLTERVRSLEIRVMMARIKPQQKQLNPLRWAEIQELRSIWEGSPDEL